MTKEYDPYQDLWNKGYRSGLEEGKIQHEPYRKLVERMADFDCFRPWGVLCNQCIAGEQPCEACEAKCLTGKCGSKCDNIDHLEACNTLAPTPQPQG
jgi:hypothetical protein